MKQSGLSSSQITSIEQLVDSGKTGLLSLSMDGQTAVFCLENGEIGSIFYKARKGLSALSLWCAEFGRFGGTVKQQFDEVPVAGNDPLFPLTETVLNRLRGSGEHATQTDIATSMGNLAPIPGVLVTDRMKAILERSMEALVGALGQQICNDVFRTTQTLRVSVEALANELPDPALAQAFRDMVREEISELAPDELKFGADELSKVEVTASAKVGVELSDDIRAMVAEVLPLFMGPAAAGVCSDVFSRTTTLRAALDHIVTEIPNPVAAEQFKDVVRKRLGVMDSQMSAA